MDTPDELLRVLTELLRARAHADEQLANGLLALVQPALPTLELPPPHHRPYRPSIAAWRSYEGFRADMIKREREALRHSRPPILKKTLADQTKWDSVRTISRVMQNYHLDPDQAWPPSAWPEHEPSGQI